MVYYTVVYIIVVVLILSYYQEDSNKLNIMSPRVSSKKTKGKSKRCYKRKVITYEPKPYYSLNSRSPGTGFNSNNYYYRRNGCYAFVDDDERKQHFQRENRYEARRKKEIDKRFNQHIERTRKRSENENKEGRSMNEESRRKTVEFLSKDIQSSDTSFLLPSDESYQEYEINKNQNLDTPITQNKLKEEAEEKNLDRFTKEEKKFYKKEERKNDKLSDTLKEFLPPKDSVLRNVSSASQMEVFTKLEMKSVEEPNHVITLSDIPSLVQKFNVMRKPTEEECVERMKISGISKSVVERNVKHKGNLFDTFDK